jgi:hypothetical protein
MQITNQKLMPINSRTTLGSQSGEVIARLAMVKGALAAHDVLEDYLERINSEWEDLTANDLMMLLRRASRDDALHCRDQRMEDLQANGNDTKAAEIFLASVRLSASI